MKTSFDRKMIVAAITVSSLALLTGCGSSSGSPAPAPVAPPVTGVGGIVGGCVPINTTANFGFTATSMYMGSQQAGDMRVLAGIVPPGDALASSGTSYGATTVTPTGVAIPVTTNPYGTGGATFTANRVDGTTLSLNVTSGAAVVPTTGYPTGYPNTAYPASGQVNATGYVQVSPFIQSMLIQSATGSTYGWGNPLLNTAPGQYPTGYPAQVNQQICISNIALSLQRTLYTGQLYLGMVYFYLNNGQHGLALNF